MNPRPTSFKGLRVNRAGFSPLASRFVATKAGGVFACSFPAKPGWRRSVLPGWVATCSTQLPGGAPKPTQANWEIVDQLPPGEGSGRRFADVRSDATPRELKARLLSRQGNSSCTNA